MEEGTDIIVRPLYLDKIRPYINKNLVKVITGQRRVGKSYILKSIAQEIRESHNREANFIFLNLEEFALSHIRDAETLHREIVSRIKTDTKNYIFIDEIQDVNSFDRVVRSLILDKKNDVYITGSNSKMLSSELSTNLAGRSIEISVHPLSYSEFLTFHKDSDSLETFNKYLRYGGLPYLINLPLENTWDEYLSGITDAVIYRDIISRHNIRNNDFLQRLLLFISDNIGQIYTAKKISDYLKSQRINISVSGVQTYIGYLLEAFIVSKVRRWDIEGKRFFEIGEKIFFEDLGLRNAIIGYRPGDIGGLLENIIFNHLKIYGYNVKIGIGKNAHEIDFVAEKNGEIKYIQVSVTILEKQTFEREFGNLTTLPDNYEKIVVTLNDSFPNTFKGIKAMTVREFLLSFQ